jgi:hypothetical protein
MTTDVYHKMQLLEMRPVDIEYVKLLEYFEEESLLQT